MKTKINKDIIERVKGLNPTLFIKKAELSDADLFVNLFNTYYTRKTSSSYFYWQFFECPFPSTLFMVFDGNILIGFFGVKIYPLNNNSNAGFAVDFLIDKIYRNKGIAFLLYEHVIEFCAENKATCLTALPNVFGNSAFKSLGFKSLGRIDTLEIDIFKKNKKIDCIETAINTNEKRLHIGFKKDEHYRMWRFKLNPLYIYKKITLEDNCFCMTKIFTDPVTKLSFGDIVDIQFECITEVSRLVDMVINEMFLQNIKTLTIWALPHTLLYKILIEKGFMNQIQERYFCLKIIDTQFEVLNNIQLWNLVQADCEIY